MRYGEHVLTIRGHEYYPRFVQTPLSKDEARGDDLWKVKQIMQKWEIHLVVILNEKLHCITGDGNFIRDLYETPEEAKKAK